MQVTGLKEMKRVKGYDEDKGKAKINGKVARTTKHMVHKNEY